MLSVEPYGVQAGEKRKTLSSDDLTNEGIFVQHVEMTKFPEISGSICTSASSIKDIP